MKKENKCDAGESFVTLVFQNENRQQMGQPHP